jgi:YggT family protein
MPAPDILTYARYVVFGAVVIAALAAIASWLVRERHVSPFSPLGRFLRGASDLLIDPVEHRLHRTGGNPQHAGWWLVVGVAVMGLLLLALLGWLLNQWFAVSGASRGGSWTTVRYVVSTICSVLIALIFVRVIASWLGAFRYNRWMRPVYLLTDWLVEPIRRAIPPGGMFDFSPLIALLAVWILRGVLLSLLPR